jgi:DNA-binding MarR family transcriptional regulator
MSKRNRPTRRKENVIEPDLMLVLNAFRRILQELRLAAGETQARYQVSAAQLFVLDELYEAGRALSIKELAELTMTDRSSVADVVDRLVAGGYASRGWSTDDRRRAEIRLTALGEKLARTAPPAPTMRLISALRELPESDLRALARGMTRLLSSLGISHEKAVLMFEDRMRARAPRSHLMRTGDSGAARSENARRSNR